METINQILARELGREQSHIDNVIKLLDEGNTIPFIARYRKELHGAMDDTALRTLEERLQYLRGLEERRESVKKSIDEQGKLTDTLKKSIENADTLTAVEDLYLPFRPKRKTRASAARAKGLEPLATRLIVGTKQSVEELAQEYCGKIRVGKINIDEQPTLALLHRVVSIPTVSIYSEGKEVKRLIGLRDKPELIEAIQEVLKK